jgi:CBS domain-containing protein
MGEQKVSKLTNKKNMHAFVKSLLNDVEALSIMLDKDMFESGITRIGAEQEMVMIKADSFKPACIAMEALDTMKEYPWVETELAKFNLETNMEPRELKGRCFSNMAKENGDKLSKIQKKLSKLDTHYLLTGILPTLRKYHMTLKNLTPKKRYRALIDSITEQQIGSSFELRLVGIDELLVKHDSPLVEAVNTSFQVHLQVDPDKFVHYYNISQAISAPIMAISANSPLVFGKRLWHESRIALFQQSLDTRSTHEHMRERSARVTFGKDWLDKSILEIYKEDIARFRVLISSDVKEKSLDLLENGEIPKLRALQVHNSTVYRWNRPCYGISDNGKPHLRIENRVIPSGPTEVDEIANAALWIGAMIYYGENIKDIRKMLSFADVRDNFGKAARFGIDSKFNWFKDKKINVCDLIIKEIAPAARKGLASRKVNKKDIDKYIGIIEQRAKKHMNGARWMLRSYTALREDLNEDAALTTLTAFMLKQQATKKPVHTWPMPTIKDLTAYKTSDLIVSDFMITDLFTVQKEDIINLVAELMDWKALNYMPVEDKKGNLEGLITSKMMLKYLVKNNKTRKTITVEQVMLTDLELVSPETSIKDAMDLMLKNKVGCLPVVKNKELIGLLTEKCFLSVVNRIID